MVSKIRACPCCGSMAKLIVDPGEPMGGGAGEVYIRCVKCIIRTTPLMWILPDDLDDIKLKILTIWNNRIV